MAGITTVIKLISAMLIRFSIRMAFPIRTSLWWCTMIWLRTNSAYNRRRWDRRWHVSRHFIHWRNPTKGILINHPDGEDVYKGVPHDYIGKVSRFTPAQCFRQVFNGVRMWPRRTSSMSCWEIRRSCKALAVGKFWKGMWVTIKTQDWWRKSSLKEQPRKCLEREVTSNWSRDGRHSLLNIGKAVCNAARLLLRVEFEE